MAGNSAIIMSTSKTILVSAVVALLVAIAFGLVGNQSDQLGGRIHNIQESFDEGIAVDGTEIVSGTGDIISLDDLFVTDDAVIGATAASGSSLVLEITSTATTSVGFESGDGKGTCFEMRSTAGTIVYARVVGTTWTVNTTSCK